MKQTGKSIFALLAAVLLIASVSARADLIASVDRDRISLGDTLQLTITATGNERLESINLSPLNNDFQVLQRSTSSSTSIVNGRRTSTRKLIIDLVARWEGTIRIPPLGAGSDATNYLLISVGPPQTGPGKEVTLSFEAELDKSSVYVQGQAILTLRIQQAINLESRSVTELQLDNAFVKQLEQASFQRTIDGRPWLIHEIRYAIFPEVSGTLEIPAQTFSARESGGRRSMLSMGGGRKLQRTTKSLTLQVLPVPDEFSGSTWLPAESFDIEEVWSTPPQQLRVGESATRTIKATARGLQSAQLPPIEFPATEGLKTYPDQAVTEDMETSSGLSASREDSVALIPTQQGTWTIPEVRIPWWDVSNKTVRYAVLPERQIVVGKGINKIQNSFPDPVSSHGDNKIAVEPAAVYTAQANPVWQYTTFAFALAWILTLLYIFYSKPADQTTSPGVSNRHESEKHRFNVLVAACGAQEPGGVREALINWTKSLSDNEAVHSLDDVAAFFNTAELSTNLEQLNGTLYGSESHSWQVENLVDLLPVLRNTGRQANDSSATPLELYPS